MASCYLHINKIERRKKMSHRKDDGLNAARGIINAIPLAVASWGVLALVIWGVMKL